MLDKLRPGDVKRRILWPLSLWGKIDDSALSLEHVFVPVTPIMFKEGIGEINETWPDWGSQNFWSIARWVLLKAYSFEWIEVGPSINTNRHKSRIWELWAMIYYDVHVESWAYYILVDYPAGLSVGNPLVFDRFLNACDTRGSPIN